MANSAGFTIRAIWVTGIDSTGAISATAWTGGASTAGSSTGRAVSAGPGVGADVSAPGTASGTPATLAAAAPATFLAGDFLGFSRGAAGAVGLGPATFLAPSGDRA